MKVPNPLRHVSSILRPETQGQKLLRATRLTHNSERVKQLFRDLHAAPTLTGKVLRLSDFYLRKFSGRIKILDEPYLSDAGRSLFTHMLKESKFYLEYGSGGSTITAARMGVPFVTVESDKRFLKAVENKIGVGNNTTRGYFHANTGWTERGGNPMFRWSKTLLSKWGKEYAQGVWDYLSGKQIVPDLILIDGRFRVASALESIKRCIELGANDKVKILVDDYARPEYKIIEQFADLVEIQGGLAIFKIKENCDLSKLCKLQEKYYSQIL